MLMFPLVAMGQMKDDSLNSNQLSFGIGLVEHRALRGDFQSQLEPVASIGFQMDLAPKSAWAIGPEVRWFGEKGSSRFLPNIIVGGLTGYDNGKFRLVGGLSAINSAEAKDHRNNDIRVFRGIATGEIGFGPVFVRGEWYTNLKTYFYSYTAQVGFRIKLN